MQMVKKAIEGWLLASKSDQISPPAPTLWTPAQLTFGGGVWYDPTDSATVFSDVAGTVPAVADDSVEKVLDKSGNGNHLIRIPPEHVAIYRGANSLEFIYNTMMVTTNTMPAMSYLSGVYQALSTNWGSYGKFWGPHHTSSARNGAITQLNKSGLHKNPYPRSARQDGVDKTPSQTMFSNVQDKSVYSIKLLLGKGVGMLNSCGEYDSKSGGHSARYSEWVVLENDPTANEQLKLEGYFAHKHGTAAKLPAAHPYKTAPPLL